MHRTPPAADPLLEAIREIVRQELHAHAEAMRTAICEDSHRGQARPVRAGLVATIAAALRTDDFTAVQIYKIAEADPELAVALEVARFPNIRSFGKYLRRIEVLQTWIWRFRPACRINDLPKSPRKFETSAVSRIARITPFFLPSGTVLGQSHRCFQSHHCGAGGALERLHAAVPGRAA